MVNEIVRTLETKLGKSNLRNDGNYEWKTNDELIVLEYLKHLDRYDIVHSGKDFYNEIYGKEDILTWINSK